ncbi:MAG: HAMP domain-containing histidine kinase [Ruminococcus sp.]|nr:HAMP domain-containing histidine kinase [Ruminococcus sp.]
MKPKKKLPLRVHLAIGFLIFSALLLIVLWMFQTVFLESFYKTIKTRQVKSCAYSLSDYIESDSFTELANEIEEQNSMIVSVYDTDIFSCVYSSGNRPGFYSDISNDSVRDLYDKAVCSGGEHAAITRIKRDMHSFKPDEKLPLDNANSAGADFNGQQGGQSQLFSQAATRDEIMQKREPSFERQESENLAYAMIINTTSDKELLLIVESEITPVNSVVDTLRFQLIIMTAVIVAFSILIAVFLAKMISRPIYDANEKAKSLAKQDYDVTFEGGRYREIAELNSTLNFAAGELKKVDSLQKELISNISHDLRTPLTMIIGYGEVMRDLPGEMTPENIQIIVDEATRLNSLVTDLLDISRLQSNTADVKKEPFSLTKCIESIFSRYTKLIENDGLNIVFEHDGEVFVMGDELRMTQVLYNLINNAINYIGADKIVIVRQTVTNDRVRIDVIDHGDGIPAEKLSYIWDRYYRVKEEHRRAKIGTGLGLSIVKNILIAHDAAYGVDSTIGEGSDFWFSLPIIPTDDEDE